MNFGALNNSTLRRVDRAVLLVHLPRILKHAQTSLIYPDAYVEVHIPYLSCPRPIRSQRT